MTRESRRLVWMAAVGPAVVLAVILAVLAWAQLYTDALWYEALGASRVFWTVLRDQSLLGGFVGLGAGLLVAANVVLARRLAHPVKPLDREPVTLVERIRRIALEHLTAETWIASALTALALGVQGALHWQALLRWDSAVSFGATDPLFHRNIGFFVFKLPLEQDVFAWSLGAVLTALALSLTVYYLTGALWSPHSTPRIAPAAQAHLLMLLGLLMALKAWGYWLNSMSLVLSTGTTVPAGASYAQIHARLPALRVLVLVALVCSVLFVAGALVRSISLPLIGIVLLGGVSVLLGGAYPLLMQRFTVDPQQFQRERPSLQANLAATREAFGIARLHAQTVSAAPPSAAALSAAHVTLSNLPIWQRAVLAQALDGVQALGAASTFTDLSTGSYTIKGASALVTLAPRMVDPSQLPASARTWQNLHLLYTHGEGVVVASAAQSSRSGHAVLLDQGFDTSSAALPVTRTNLYFGQQPPGVPGYVVVTPHAPRISPDNSHALEPDRPGIVAGVRLDSMLRRIAFAIRFRDVNLVLSQQITRNSRMLFNRGIRAATSQLAPFLQWGAHPYVVIAQGQVDIIRNGYTTSNSYPNATPVDLAAASEQPSGAPGLSGTANYIRSSVVSVTNAATGATTLYARDPTDPLLRADQRAFPGLIRPLRDLAASVRSHLTYPSSLFAIQASQLAAYHFTNVAGFYAHQNVWQVPPSRSGPVVQQSGTLSVVPPVTRARPTDLLGAPSGGAHPAVMLSMPLVQSGGDLAAQLLGSLDASGAPQLTLATVTRGTAMTGPGQADTRILGSPAVSRDIARLAAQGLRVTAGNVLTVPVGGGVLDVQAVFTEGQTGTGPQLRGIAVLLGDQVGYGRTLMSALADAQGSGVGALGSDGAVQGLLSRAAALYAQGQSALKAGKLGTYQQDVQQAFALVQQAQHLATSTSGGGH